MRNQRSPLFARNARDHAAPGIDRGGDAGIGFAQQPAIVFDGPHARLIQVLREGAAISIPSVIGNIHQKLRALISELPDLIGKDRLIADENSKPLAACVERYAGCAVSELADFFGQAAREGK